MSGCLVRLGCLKECVACLSGQSVNWKIQLSAGISGLLMPLLSLQVAGRH